MAGPNFERRGQGNMGREEPNSRTRVMDAALRLFAMKGFAAVTIGEIIKDAEVTRPTLYHYFGSKEGLYLELVERLCSSVEDSILHDLNFQGTARERLRTFMLDILGTIADDSGDLRFFYSIIVHDPRLDIMASFHERMRNFVVSILELLLEDGVAKGEFRPEEVCHAAKAMNAYGIAFIHNQLFLPDTMANRVESERLLDRLLDQIAAA